MTERKRGAIRGRPTKYSEEVIDQIINKMIEGRDIVSICEDPGMPPRSSIYDWLDSYPEFRARYAKAKEGLADVYARKILSLAENNTPENSAADSIKLRAWTWATSRYAPRLYSEKVVADQATQVNVQINNTTNNVANLAQMSSDEKAELKRLLLKARGREE